MTHIQNDQDLRQALERLSPGEQRRIGGMFVQSAVDLCDDVRVRRAAEVAMNPNASEEEREDAFHSVKAFAVHSYTECGRDTDWTRQASHFVGVAAACLLSDDESGDGANHAWKVAMHVRNARNCALIAHTGSRGIDAEAERQRRIASEFATG